MSTIELFSTTLVHPDRSRIIIPNRKIVGEILHNFGSMRQLHLTLMVPHGSDHTAVLAMAREVVAANPKVLADPSAVIGIAQVEIGGVKVGVHPWVRVPDVVAVEAELYKALAERFREARHRLAGAAPRDPDSRGGAGHARRRVTIALAHGR